LNRSAAQTSIVAERRDDLAKVMTPDQIVELSEDGARMSTAQIRAVRLRVRIYPCGSIGVNL
jgi:hypothetical protein